MDMLAYSLPMLAVAGLLWLAVRLTRKAPRFTLAWRGAAGDSGPRLRPVARIALAPGHSLHLVEWGGREILLGVSPAGITPIDASSGTRPAAGESESGERRSPVPEALSRLLAARGGVR